MKTTLLLVAALLTGCALPQKTNQPVTASVASHLDITAGDLSRVDGKAVVIEKWLQSH